MATLLLALVDGDDPVELPPVEQVELVQAARSAGCRLERGEDAPLNPSVAGAAEAPPATPGIYRDSPDTDRLVAALRRGWIVIHYRPGLDDRLVQALAEIQRTVPRGTLLVPNATRMRYEVAVTAWRRLLGCRRLSPAAIDALRLFHGRFLGAVRVE